MTMLFFDAIINSERLNMGNLCIERVGMRYSTYPYRLAYIKHRLFATNAKVGDITV